jgi:hypothetical protein
LDLPVRFAEGASAAIMIVQDAAMPLPVKVNDKWAINKSDNLTDLKDL